MLQVQTFLEKANKEIVDTKKLSDFFVGNLMTLFVLYLRVKDKKNPFRVKRKKTGQTFIAAFTDRDAVDKVRLTQQYDVELVEEPILSFLLQTYRSDASGLILNPGLPSCFYILKEYLQKIIVEYAVDQLAKMNGAWIPTKNDHMLLVEYKHGIYTVAIYSRKEDAELMCKEAGGTPILHSWKDIFERAQKVRANSLFLHFHLPEQEYLTNEHLEKIWKGSHQGYQESEPISHPYHIQLIGQESKQQTTSDQEASKQETTPSSEQLDSQSKTVEEKSSDTESEPIAKEEEKKPIQHPFTVKETANETENEEKEQTETVNQREEQEEKKLEQKEREPEKHYPSERVNPYSIKNKKERELEIYRGGKVEEEPLDFLRAKPEKRKQVKREHDQRKQEKREPEEHQSHILAEPVKKSNRPPSRKEVPTQKKVGNVGIPEDVRIGLERLEKATIEGQGMANGWEVCQVLAEIRRIWIIVDQQENMVILAGQDQSPIVDFFTSDVYAQRLIDEAHQNNPNLPAMSPQLVSTKKLYRALAPRQPIVWINRGSSGAWTSVMGDTLPYVLQLQAQLQ